MLSSTRAQHKRIGNDVGSKEKGLGIKRTASGAQPTLGFSTKKTIVQSPAKKKANAAIDLTLSTPPAPKSFPLFDRPSRSRTTSDVNPFETEENPDAARDQVERDEFGYISTVPATFGKEKPTPTMLANLESKTVNDKEVEGVESEGEVEVDPAFFLTEGARVAELDDEELPAKVAHPDGISVRKAMIEGEDGDGKSRKKSNPKDKKWDGIAKETMRKMGTNEPIHCTPKSHDRFDHILRVFDLSSEWGPSVGITRLERWKRAEAWGLEPPAEVRDILLGEPEKGETVFHGRGIYVP